MATRTNLIRNPSFELNVTDNTALEINSAITVTKTRDTSAGNFQVGVASCKVDLPTNSELDIWRVKLRLNSTNGLNLPAGSYQASVWVKASANRIVQLAIEGSGAGKYSANLSITTGWTRISFGFTADGSNVSASFNLLLNTGTAGTVWVDGAMVEQTTALGAYFDGATPDTASIDYAWAGTAHNSVSTASDIATPSNTTRDVRVSGVAGLSAARTQDVRIIGYSLSTASLADTFDDNSPDLALWKPDGPNIAEVNNQLEIVSIAGGASYSAYHSAVNRDLTGSYMYAQVKDAGNQSLATWQVIPVQAVLDDANTLTFMITTGRLVAQQQVNGNYFTIAGGATYDPAVHKYLRMREADGTTYFDTSVDAQTWTNYASAANPFALSNINVHIAAGTYNGEATPTKAIINNFNSNAVSSNVAYVTRIIGSLLTSAAQDVRIYGQNASSLAVDTRLRGQNTDNTSRDTRIKGQATSSANRDARLTGTAVASQTQDTRIRGQATSSQNVDVRLIAQTASSTNQDVRAIGTASLALGITARLIGQAALAAAYDVRLVGTAVNSYSQDTRIIAQDSSAQNQDARITGSAGAAAAQDARLIGTATSSRAQDSKVTGQATANVSQDANITGTAISQSAAEARVTGQNTAVATQEVRLAGSNGAVATQDLRITGQATATIAVEVRIKGQLASTNERFTRTIGAATSTIAANARLTGAATNTYAQTTRITGTNSSQYSIAARVTGQATSSIAQTVRLIGAAAAQVAFAAHITGTDDTAIEFVARAIGSAVTAASFGAHVVGQATTSFEVAVHITAQAHTTVERATHIHGAATAAASANAHINGQLVASVSFAVAITGQDPPPFPPTLPLVLGMRDTGITLPATYGGVQLRPGDSSGLVLPAEDMPLVLSNKDVSIILK